MVGDGEIVAAVNYSIDTGQQLVNSIEISDRKGMIQKV